jgi:preprotein translocase subunit SecA
MTGTADTEAYEFQEIYGLETVIIPPHRPSRRVDDNDRVYKTTQEKYQAAIDDIRDCHGRGQPVLVGTSSIENSELISQLLTQVKLPHQVLNAKQHAREADIIAQAGAPKAITIATNMAGRGTDIVLGGNIEKAIAALESDESVSDEEKAKRMETMRAQWQQDHDFVVQQGGLRIIATERHESRRIDNQLRGRSGRQGDPGSSRFFLSLDDPLMRIFAGERVKAIMDRLKMPEGEAIEAGMVNRSIESAQRKVEARNFDIRKQLLEYDDVSNDQRKVIYQQRNDILDAADLNAQIAGLRHGCFTDLVRQFVPAESVEEQWDLLGLQRVLKADWALSLDLVQWVQQEASVDDQDLVEKVVQSADQAFGAKVDLVGVEQFTPFMRMVLLQSIDNHWREHLAALDHLRQGIHLRGYAQKQPKQEYKREAFELFSMLLDLVKNEVTRTLMTVEIQSREQADQAAQQLEEQAENISNVTYTAPTETGEPISSVDPSTVAAQVPQVGRNEPCPCGSGKKYKHCHGQLS